MERKLATSSGAATRTVGRIGWIPTSKARLLLRLAALAYVALVSGACGSSDPGVASEAVDDSIVEDATSVGPASSSNDEATSDSTTETNSPTTSADTTAPGQSGSESTTWSSTTAPTSRQAVSPQPLRPFMLDGSAHPSEWALVFQDEFQGAELDSSVWTACYWWDDQGCTNEASNSLEWYLPEQRVLEDGALHLRAVEDQVTGTNGRRYPYRSGMVTTGEHSYQSPNPPGFAFTYGFVEVRAKVPAGRGLWPAIWLLAASQDELPEIDILEVLGHRPDRYELHMHTRDSSGRSVSYGGDYTSPLLEEGWHVISVNWTPDAVVWVIDGVERWRVEENIPDEDMYLILNMAVGGDWPGSPDAETVFPADFSIDYVRIWQAAE